MFDVGFSEILLTSAIALVVLGPEKLPKVARQVGNWMGRARAMARQLTEQLEREVSADELMKTTRAPAPKPIAPVNPEVAAAPTAANAAAPVAAPSPFDTSYVPTTYVPSEASSAPPPSASASSQASYSPNPAQAPHGADWQPAPPPETRPHNE